MLGLGLSLQKGISAFNAGRALVSSYIRRVTEAGGVLQNTACDAAAINELNQDRLLEPASWVLVPDGIKEDVVYAQKPTSGLGDLTFTRSSDATYTDSTGVVRRSPYNLVQFSEQFDNAYWPKPSGTISVNVTTAPNGTITADKYIVNNGQTTNSPILSTFVFNTNTAYTLSLYVKKADYDTASIRLYTDQTGFSTCSFNLANGTASGGTISALSNSWFRVSVSFTTASTVTNGQFQLIRDAQIRDGVAGIFIWGAQLVEGTSALDYFPTTNRQDVPRIDFRNADGTLSSCGRLLLEPQRTNSIRNSSMVGAMAGSPGTLPTNWTQGGGGGSVTTRTIVGTGTENGLPYIDIRYQGNTAGQLRLITESGAIAAATVGSVYTNSTYIKLVSGTAPQIQLVISNRDASNNFLSDNNGPLFNIIGTLTRYAYTATIAQAGTAFAQPLLQWAFAATAYDFTIRIAAPQMELGSYATTWVPTTTAAVTRIADVASKTGVSSLIGQTEGTLFVDLDGVNGLDNPEITLDDNSNNNRIVLTRFLSTGFWSLFTASAGVSGLTSSSVSNNNGKFAIAYNSTNYVVYRNGVLILTRTAALPVSLSAIRLNGRATNDLYGAKLLAQAALFPTRLTNDQLEVLTSEGYGNYALLAQSLNYVLQ